MSRRKKQRIKPINIRIAMLTGGSVCSDTAFCFNELFAYTMLQGYSMSWSNPKVSRIETGRNMAANAAVDEGVDYLLFVDSDMTFPREALMQLIGRGVDIVGVNACKRTVPFLPVYTKDINGEFLNFQSGRMYEMDYIGMAFTLIKVDVFRNMEKPYFYSAFSEMNHTVPLGEDICFSREARKAGYKVYCDMAVSMGIGHIVTHPLYLPKDFTEDTYHERLSEAQSIADKIAKHL